MRKFIRLSIEALRAFRIYKNPLTYIKERLKQFPDKKIVLNLRNGLRIKITTNTNEIGTLNEIWHLRVYDQNLHFICEDSTIIDIGANIGTFSLKAARLARRGQVLSFEPFPQNFELLVENINFNNFKNVIKPANLAIAGKRGELDLYYHERDSGGGSLYRHGDLEKLRSIKVKCITLQDVFQENQVSTCDFLKIDAEGAEEDILLNTPSEIIKKIKSLTLEWHDDLSRIGFDKFKNFLLNSGYSVDFNKKTGTLDAKRK